jgi:hypothetical protein
MIGGWVGQGGWPGCERPGRAALAGRASDRPRTAGAHPQRPRGPPATTLWTTWVSGAGAGPSSARTTSPWLTPRTGRSRSSPRATTGVAVRSVAGVRSRVPVSQGPVPPPAITITTPARATRTAPLVPLDLVKKWSRPRQHSWTVVPPDYDLHTGVSGACSPLRPHALLDTKASARNAACADIGSP